MRNINIQVLQSIRILMAHPWLIMCRIVGINSQYKPRDERPDIKSDFFDKLSEYGLTIEDVSVYDYENMEDSIDE